jgi:hypothetical protein
MLQRPLLSNTVKHDELMSYTQSTIDVLSTVFGARNDHPAPQTTRVAKLI